MGSRTSYGEVDILVVGAGSAGATAALNLAPTWRVAMVDLRPDPPARIGESLPPAARRLLADMGLWESFLAEGHSPWYGNHVRWGTTAIFQTDFIRDPDGHGWHLDRARFERWLRNAAIDRGAALLTPARLKSIHREAERWQALIETACGPAEITAHVVIDAGGRGSPAARCLGARRRIEDRLVCGYLYGTVTAAGPVAGFTYVQSAEDGWWYSAPLPGGRRILAFHTDADLPGAHFAADGKKLWKYAAAQIDLAALLTESGFASTAQSGFTAAHSAVLQPVAGSGWLAVGDAACSFDPLSSQGLLNALFTGLAAAEAADRHLAGSAEALPEYLETVQRVHESYRHELIHWYGVETRWSHSPFWKRRQSIPA